MMTNPNLYNKSGCLDLTAFKAITAADHEIRRDGSAKAKPAMVYICSPYRGNTEGNAANALRYCRFAVERGKFPIAPHCYLPRFMDDGNPAERELALSFGVRLLCGCRELWVFGTEISAGMKREILAAKRRGIRIRRFSAEMEEM
jgi:hypothetical protein